MHRRNFASGWVYDVSYPVLECSDVQLVYDESFRPAVHSLVLQSVQKRERVFWLARHWIERWRINALA